MPKSFIFSDSEWLGYRFLDCQPTFRLFFFFYTDAVLQISVLQKYNITCQRVPLFFALPIIYWDFEDFVCHS